MTWVFFSTLVILGGYFAIDLIMGVLGNEYLRAKSALKTLKHFQRERSKEMENDVVQGKDLL